MYNKVISTAPGKLILTGEHSVVYGKEALACSLNLRTECTIQTLKDNFELCLEIPLLDLATSFSIEDISQQIHQNDVDPEELFSSSLVFFSKYMAMFDVKVKQTAVHVLLFLFSGIALQHMKKNNVGMKVFITSTLPIGCGLGSSAALAVAVASSLLVYCNLISENYWVEKDIMLINKWAYLCEKIIHGNPSGIDNAVSIFGDCISFKSGEINRIHCGIDMKVLIINTGVSRNTKDIVTSVREKSEKFPMVYHSLFETMDKVSTTFKNLLTVNADEEKNKSSYFEHLIDINQHLLEAIGVSHPVVNKVITICKKHGLHPKITGAGGGGCVYSLVTDISQSVLDLIINDIKEYDWWVTKLGGDGVKLIHAN
ncbi:mevalonate kinase isoform X2 [Hydra vulgaris]|uniref:mevalonate kinase isoform X2 n=1 Tax=Hydra vulgaris TaxID=6087 RepID=UPI001F5E8FDF|nr:mevalonate kinase isoform X2 [Hydra vulgaris]